MNKFKEKYIGDKNFYKYTLGIALPLILQNLITNFVSMIDNIMVGSVGTEQMNGVSIANQYTFVFNITIFGAIAGASIFGTQFFGKGDSEGQKYTFRFRLIIATIVVLIGALIFYSLDDQLIGLFISGDDEKEVQMTTLKYGKQYMRIMILGLVPFGIGQAYSSVVRECGETKIAMYSSMAAIGVNLFLDYALIFGNFGMPKLGVEGAAIATVIAKYIEALVVIIWAHTNPEKNRYIVGLYKSIYIPGNLVKKIIIKGYPLLFNEFLWSLGMSIVAQSYSVLGLKVVAARNIATTITNLFGVVYIQMGASIGIILGMKLGAGKLDEARRDADKLAFFSIALSCIITVCTIPIAFVFPMLYNTSSSVRNLATYMIIINALTVPLWSYTNACYFTLRSGGKTGITFLFDFVYTWVLLIPLAFVLTHFTNLEIHLMIAIISFSEIIKAIVGYYMKKSGIWIQNIVE